MNSSFKIFLTVLVLLSVSRFTPHPPNFTSLIALSFYVPAIFGIKKIIFVILALFITDIFIGFHNTIFFTIGSVGLIGLSSLYLKNSLVLRMSGALIGVILFYLITNFGVWSSGVYGYDLKGLINCYVLALPFLGNTLISTVLYSFIIECLFSFKIFKLNIKKYK